MPRTAEEILNELAPKDRAIVNKHIQEEVDSAVKQAVAENTNKIHNRLEKTAGRERFTRSGGPSFRSL